ncbi:uroporphyrinogen-III synthase [Parafrankia sp. FMc6]|uniref:uroporphyrinogen-III synthase n=1 Tax=Parafrankia soli TaxID=2599596 RepID=UPI0034D65884
MTDSGPVTAPVEPLAGYTVALTAARRREEFGAALERRGAKVVYAPAIRIVPLADDARLREATERCIAAPVDVVVATTGIGFRGWVDAAETWGLADRLVAAFESADLLARGPKARGAIRATGLREAWSPESESSSEVMSYLTAHGGLDGKRIAVQLHGEPLPDMLQTLRAAGAEVIEIPVYRWVPAQDMAPVRRVVECVAARSLDAVAFTSAPAAASFLQTADEMALQSAVAEAMRGPVVAACVGPVTAAPLGRAGIPCVIPSRGRLGALVREIVEQVPIRRGLRLCVGERALDVRGHAVAVDGVLVALPAASMTLLRALAARPGYVVSRADLLNLTGTTDEHALEVAVGRLRTSLGDPALIRTVVKRGYRLDCEPVSASSGCL